MADTPVKKDKNRVASWMQPDLLYMEQTCSYTFPLHKCSGVVVGDTQGEHAYGSRRSGGQGPDGLRH